MLVKACKISDINDILSIDINAYKIILVKRGNNIYALDRICTHRYADLANGFINEDTITCPLHLAQFDITNGSALSPPAERPLKLYNIKIDDDYIYIDLT